MCRRKEAHQSRDIARQMRFVPQRILPGLRVDLRSANEKGALKRVMIKVLDAWYRYFENQVNCGFDLSLIAVAEKASCDTTDA